MNEVGKFPHYNPFLLFINLIHLKFGEGGTIHYHFTYSSSHLPLINTSFLNYAIYILAWFIIWKKGFLIHIDGSSFLMHKFYVLQQEEEKYIKIKWANVVNTRTNICYTYGCHTRVNHEKNHFHSCISKSWNDLLLHTITM